MHTYQNIERNKIMNDQIRIKDAFQNNLKHIDLTIDKHQWITVTGISGSGKSSLVFDVIYAQAQKEFLESLSSYARRNFPKIGDVDVQQITGLSPCIVIDQSSFPNTPRSTVGTYTDIYSYLRLLFSRAGDGIFSAADFSFNNAFGVCPVCNGLGDALTPDFEKLIDTNLSLNEGAIQHRTWKVGSRYWNIIRAINYFDMDKKVKDFTEEEIEKLLYCKPFVYQNDEPGHVQSFSYEGIISRMIKRKNDSRGLSATDYDAQFFTSGLCPECRGTRLREEIRNVKIGGRYTIGELVNMEISDLADTLSELHGDVEDVLIPPILKLLKNLISVGLSYITLNRSAHTLSGGEAQKVKLAKALGCSLNDMIYILDEPTAGLHPVDIIKMKKIIRGMVDAGNTVIVIEHHRDMILASDTIIDIGPEAGRNGGTIVFNGNVADFKENTTSVTAQYIRQTMKCFKSNIRSPKGNIELQNINRNNVHHLDVKIPKNVMTCITGVSGAGKSTILDVLVERVPKAIVVDQSSVGANIRGNAATYTKVFDDIREFFSSKTGFDASSFSFNSTGSCPNCNGLGYTVTDMHFMGDIRTPCDKCGGRRYTEIVLEQRINGANIADVLDMTVSEAIEFFSGQPFIKRKLNMLQEVGLEYITLGQPLSTLSGGELQRLKLAGKITNKGNIYIFDEPTHGLHFKDTERLIAMMNRIANYGNTLIVVEHNMEVVLQSDWIIDMGPFGGKNGGRIVYQGIPKNIVSCKESQTGQYLNQFLGSSSGAGN